MLPLFFRFAILFQLLRSAGSLHVFSLPFAFVGPMAFFQAFLASDGFDFVGRLRPFRRRKKLRRQSRRHRNSVFFPASECFLVDFFFSFFLFQMDFFFVSFSPLLSDVFFSRFFFRFLLSRLFRGCRFPFASAYLRTGVSLSRF